MNKYLLIYKPTQSIRELIIVKQDMILILDLGGKNNTQIARAVRDLGVYSEIKAHDITVEEIDSIDNLKGIIINGGPNNIIDGKAIDIRPEIASADIPMFCVSHYGCIQQDLAEWPANQDELTLVLQEFLFRKCKAEKNWNMDNFISDQIELLRRQIGNKKVLLALSGGVDSSVVAALLIKAVGNQLTCVHVNHGLMRKGESEQVINVFREQLAANLIFVDASDRFLDKLVAVNDPEQKRKIIGSEFIRVFEEEARKLQDIELLAQGTIYPDIIESGTKTVKAVKSHHNVGGLPDDLQFELVEPIKQLFKDEVRQVGLALGLPENMVFRQPFPGPGLGVRCPGAITRERLELVRETDAILRDEFAKAGLDKKVWQYFTVVPDFKSVGVRDGVRTFSYPVILRAINTIDAMTAAVEPLEWDLLQKISSRMLNEVPGINRVLWDITPKPPATIEYE